MQKRALFGLRVNRAAMYMLFFASGVLGGIAVVAFTPGAPWSSFIEPAGATTAEALDLAAQRSMAASAWWMVVIAGAGGAVGGLSLLLILHTLRAAQRSAVAAERTIEMTYAGVRAYLLVDFAKLRFTETFSAIVDYQVSNSGQSPAKDVALAVDVYAAETRAAERHWVGRVRKSRSDIPATGSRKAVASIPKFSQNEMTRRKQPSYAVIVTITLEYRDVITMRHHKEISTYGCMVPWVLPRGEQMTLYRDVGGETGWGD